MDMLPPVRNDANAHSYLATLEVIECPICYLAFSDVHAPVALRCHHIFGLQCLREWILSPSKQHNKCPKCRAVLFSNGLPLMEDPTVGNNDQEAAMNELLVRPLQPYTATGNTIFGSTARDAPQVIGRFSETPRFPPNDTYSPPVPPQARAGAPLRLPAPFQQQDLQPYLYPPQQLAMTPSGFQSRNNYIPWPLGLPFPLPPQPFGHGIYGPPPWPATQYMANAPSRTIHPDRLCSHNSQPTQFPPPSQGVLGYPESLAFDRYIYPSAPADSTLMDYLTVPHRTESPRPGVFWGEWPYQYPAVMQPNPNDLNDLGLHRLALDVVRRRREELARRGSLEHIQGPPGEGHPEYDVEAVRRMLGGR